jgi:hypothetical protein
VDANRVAVGQVGDGVATEGDFGDFEHNQLKEFSSMATNATAIQPDSASNERPN